MVVKQKIVAAPAPTPTAPSGPIVIELVGYGRYFWDGVLYLKGIKYVCETQEQATRMLTHENEGKRPFQVWAEKKVEETKESMFQPLPTPTAALAGTGTVTQKGLEIGTPEEEKELGLDKVDEPGTTEL